MSANLEVDWLAEWHDKLWGMARILLFHFKAQPGLVLPICLFTFFFLEQLEPLFVWSPAFGVLYDLSFSNYICCYLEAFGSQQWCEMLDGMIK